MDIPKVNNSEIRGLNNYSTESQQPNPNNQIGVTFAEALDSLSQSQETSDNLVQQLAAGEDVDIHNVMIAAEQTDINFRIAMAIRDKLVAAYQEIMRMSV
jgi:flagellar hook-basal body complex protein FliE